MRVGARKGILFKTATALEQAGRTRVIALDKTGTITKGAMTVTDVMVAHGTSKTELLQTALDLEAKSEHPLAKAVVRAAAAATLEPGAVEDFAALAGNGVTARRTCDGALLYGGSLAFIETKAAVSDDMRQAVAALSAQGKTPLLFASCAVAGAASDRAADVEPAVAHVLGVIGVADVIKEDSAVAISALRALGIRTVMLSGDNERTARAIAAQAGVDDVIAGVLPAGKESAIKRLKAQFGAVAMVGDGINDAPALTQADTGIAIGAGTDVALDAADIVLMHSRLTDVVHAIRLSRATLRTIHENLFWAFFYNVALIPVAAGAYYASFGLALNPMLGAAAMSLSSFCVVTNALRLNLIRLPPLSQRAKAAKTIHTAPAEKTGLPAELAGKPAELAGKEKAMSETTEKVIKVEGMMCGHCEMHVKKALEAVDGVTAAQASHEKGEVVLTLAHAVDTGALEKAVTDAGYTYRG